MIPNLIFQIAPFDIEFSVTHKELDFSHLLVCASKSDTLLDLDIQCFIILHCKLITCSGGEAFLDLSAVHQE